ncbi:MAG: hypothetical protein QGG71_05215, partial [Pirellulaceae bacterium]|nr:hypothetical protein [Pirellulaceae bacterium]
APRTKRIDRGAINDYLAKRPFFFNPKIKNGQGTSQKGTANERKYRSQLTAIVIFSSGSGYGALRMDICPCCNQIFSRISVHWRFLLSVLRAQSSAVAKLTTSLSTS